MTEKTCATQSCWHACCSTCCSSVLDPLQLIYGATMIANFAVAVTCLTIWIILFTNVALQIFVATEASYHQIHDYEMHTMVTLSLLPTLLLYWTWVMWCATSHLLEWLQLLWATPRIKPIKRSILSIGDYSSDESRFKKVRSNDFVHTSSKNELREVDLEPFPVDAECAVPLSSAAEISKLYAQALDLEKKAQLADFERQTALLTLSHSSHGALKTSLATKAQIAQLAAAEKTTESKEGDEEQGRLLPGTTELDGLISRTTKLAAHARLVTRPKYMCSWSDYMLASPFVGGINTCMVHWLLVGAIAVEVVVLVSCNAAGVLGGAHMILLLIVITGVLLMLWSLLDAAAHCSRAFWLQWCYFAGCALLSALLCLVDNDWPNQFVTTAVIVYVAVMFAASSLFVMHEVWVLPLQEFWSGLSAACTASTAGATAGNALYFSGMGAYWLGVVAVLAAFFVSEFTQDTGGVYLRVAFQLCWTASCFVFVGKTLMYPRSPPQVTPNIDAALDATPAAFPSHSSPTLIPPSSSTAYGQLMRGHWNYFLRLVVVGYFCLLLGVLGGAWAAGRLGWPSGLVYLAGPLAFTTTAVAALWVLNSCGQERLRRSGWSFPAVRGAYASGGAVEPAGCVGKLLARLQCLFEEEIVALWAWDLFRTYTMCVLLVLIIAAGYSKLRTIVLFLLLVVMHGYMLVEYHFFSPLKTEISMAGVPIATLHEPRRRLYPVVLMLLLFCDVMVVGAATWSLTTSYSRVNDATQARSEELASSSASSVQYAICQEQTFHTLDVVDLAYMTQLTYFQDPVDSTVDCGKDDPANLQTCLVNYFTTNYTKASTNDQPYSWQVLNVSIPTDSAESSHAAYYGVRSASANLIVVGVRGSTTGRDWLEDFNLYSEASLLQLFSLVVPMTYVWPYEATAAMVKAFSFSQQLLYASDPSDPSDTAPSAYYQSVLTYARGLQAAYPTYDLLLLGHSLGGAVAQIAAARMGVRGFGFEPPGTVFSQKKFGIRGGVQALSDTLVTVVRDNDPIAYVDAHAGQVQQLACESSSLSVYCHYMQPITCHLMSHCGALSRVTFDHWGGGLAYCGAE